MPRLPRKFNSVRINLEISSADKDRLELIQAKTDARSMVEVVSRSLAVYSALIEQEAQGNEVLIRCKDGREKGLLLITS